MNQLFRVLFLFVFVSGLALAQDTPTLFAKGQTQVIPPSPDLVVLYDQTAGAGTISLVSQNFEASFDAYDNQGADDFEVPAGETWSIESIDVLGAYFNGVGPAYSFNVWFYTDAAGLPGTEVASEMNASYTDPGGLGSVTITLSPAIVLNAGSYWVSIQANIDFGVGGEWGWTEHLPMNTESAWQNPGGGFGLPCTSWGYRVTTCGLAGTAGYTDYAFRLNGTMPTGGILLISKTTIDADSVEVWLNALGETYTRITSTAALAMPTSDWLTYDAAYWIGYTLSTAEMDSCIAYLNGGGNLLIADHDEGYYTGSDPIFLDYLMSQYVSDAGSDGTITGMDIMAGLSMDISADPYPDDVLPNTGAYGTGVPIFLAPTGTTYAGMRGPGGTFRSELLCWSARYGASHSTNLAIFSKTYDWLAFGIVPVELSSFTATVNQNKVELNWVTATETNNQGFDIERNSGSGFEKVGYIPGFGTTTEEHSYSFTDVGLSAGNYSYRLKQIDFSGMFEYSKTIEVEVVVPDIYSLAQNYPNPFNPSTKITFSLAADSKVSLKVFDVLGQEVASLINQDLTAGVHNVDFNAAGFNSGVYFYRIEASGVNGAKFVDVKKMILMK
jgi:hypothetical protein